jgi:hypothetical protein
MFVLEGELKVAHACDFVCVNSEFVVHMTHDVTWLYHECRYVSNES